MIPPDSDKVTNIAHFSLSHSSGAVFDMMGQYRYALWRVWSGDSPRIAFIMLNPNTADAQRDDPTIRRCIGFARAWGFGSLEVVNLFAYRAPDPLVLSRIADPIGTDNNHFLEQAATRAHCIVVAWGTKSALLNRDQAVLRLLTGQDRLYCLGRTRDGYPRHPLYVRGDAPLLVFGK